MASNGGAPENLMDLMDQAPAQPPGSSKKADKGTSKKSAPASSLSVDGVPPQAQLSKPAGATDAKKQKKVISITWMLDFIFVVRVLVFVAYILKHRDAAGSNLQLDCEILLDTVC
jgi:hypothetical protein